MQIRRTTRTAIFVCVSILAYCTYSYAIPRIRSGGGGGGSGGGNSFETMNVPAGTDPVAESSTDTLNITETTFLTLTGTAGTDTIDITQVTTDIGTDGLIATNAVALTTDTTGNYANGDAEAGAALTGDSATSFFTTGNIDVAQGGTGTTTLTDGGILLGSGTGAITALGVATNGQIPIGDGTTDPVLATITGTANEVTVTNGAGTITLDLPLNAGTDITADLEEEVTSGSLADNVITDAELATTETIQLPIYSAKLTGAFVVRTPTSGDASTAGAQIDAGDGNWRLLFDATTDEAAVWQFVLPDYWAAHGELKIFYSMTSATTLEVEFEADLMCVTPGDAADIGTSGFAGVAVGSDTVPGTAGFMDPVNITLTDDACAAGDVIFVYLSTDANDAVNDDATGDREVVGLAYEFTR